MSRLRSGKFILSLIIIIVVGSAAFFYYKKRTYTANEEVIAFVSKGLFEVTVHTSGELEAKNSVLITGPQTLRRAHIWNIKLAELVEEGKRVKKGEMVAQLDQTEVSESLKNELLDVENRQLELTQAKIDTALELQQARNNLENLLSTFEEKKLELEKSVFEPPVTIKQAEVNLARAERNYKQAIEEYDLKLEKAVSRVRSAEIKLQKSQSEAQVLEELISQLTILAPEDGMVIYTKDHRGNKIVSGSMISSWNPVVAELPDLNVLISKTYVNEVDIRKVMLGQSADITFDAFPEKKMKGKVVKVANVGESIQGNDAKVFRVDIEMQGTDKDLKPAMTTGNSIITASYDEVLYVPIETVYNQGDTLSYVYLTEKFNIKKQQVLTGDRNDRDVVILAGLKESDKVLFLPPEDSDELKISRLVISEDHTEKPTHEN